MSSLGPEDDRRLATLCALGAAFVLPCVDAMVKWLVADYSVIMVAWVRMGVIAIVLGVAGGSQIGIRILRPIAWRLQILRGASAVLGTVMVFLGFRAMPLAECLAIVSIAPVLADRRGLARLPSRARRLVDLGDVNHRHCRRSNGPEKVTEEGQTSAGGPRPRAASWCEPARGGSGLPEASRCAAW